MVSSIKGDVKEQYCAHNELSQQGDPLTDESPLFIKFVKYVSYEGHHGINALSKDLVRFDETRNVLIKVSRSHWYRQ